MSDKNTKKKKNSRKGIIALVLLFASAIIISGSLFAYFSDVVSGNGQMTAGTLDITGQYKFYVNGSATPVASVANFNPGDVVVVKATITNTGNKSAWVRNVVDFGTLDTDIAPYIKIYEGETTAATIQAGTATLLPLTGSKYETTAKIIDGTGSAAETETGTNALGSNVNAVAYTIYFDTTATNAAQGKTVAFTAKTQALQYRNNTTIPTSTAWDTVVTTAFGS